MTTTHEIWICRHGETAWTKTGQHTGRIDIELTERGRAEAVALGAKLASRPFALVLTSPLRRAAETCRLAGYGDVAKPCDDLMEWDYGADEGHTRDEIRRTRPGWTIWKEGPRGGETLDQVATRARRALALAAAAGGDVALFAHGHLLRVLTACFLDLPPSEGRHFELGTASVGVLATGDGTGVVRSWNRG